MTGKITATETGDDGTEVPLDAELAAALACRVRESAGRSAGRRGRPRRLITGNGRR